MAERHAFVPALTHHVSSTPVSILRRREGDIIPGQPAGSIAYVLKAAQHERFSRNGADLVHRVKLPLSRALAGGSITVQTLDDR
jgi:DnaJ-class molecular chaperone